MHTTIHHQSWLLRRDRRRGSGIFLGLIRIGLVAAMSSFAPSAGAAPRSSPWGAEFGSCEVLPTKEDVDKAKTNYRKGQAAFNEGAYSQCVALWLTAYRLDCHAHALLLNLATAFELSGRTEDAVRALLHYNEREPDSEYVEPNRKRIERLENDLLKRQGSAAKQAASLAPEQAPPPSPPPPPRPPPSAPTSSVALMLDTAGAVLALSGGALFLEGRLSAASAASSCESRARCQDFEAVVLGERARARATAGGWLVLAGTVVGATGLGWHWFDNTNEQPSDTVRSSWSAAVSAESASVRWQRSF